MLMSLKAYGSSSRENLRDVCAMLAYLHSRPTVYIAADQRLTATINIQSPVSLCYPVADRTRATAGSTSGIETFTFETLSMSQIFPDVRCMELVHNRTDASVEDDRRSGDSCNRTSLPVTRRWSISSSEILKKAEALRLTLALVSYPG